MLNKAGLAPYAVCESRGRKFKERIEDERLPFQRDKDRIIHSKAFRRLDEKTQVFMAGIGDHYRTRLTHSLEVAQIAGDIARRLEVNEDLCEAIALAHDLGHPPFGHSGEQALDWVMKVFGMHFEHNEQSRRIVEELEKTYPTFDGLNLTFEVLDGLKKHQTAYDQKGKVFEKFAHLEAQIVNVADEIAYTNHDMDDGLRAEFISIKQLKKFVIWKRAEKEVEGQYGKIRDVQILRARVISTIIANMIDDFCKQTRLNLKKNKIVTLKDVEKYKGCLASFSEKMKLMLKDLRKFLYEHFYMHPIIKAYNLKGTKMIKRLFEYYYKNPGYFPKKDKGKLFQGEKKNKDFVTAIKDYIAGMTDRYLLQEYKKLVL